MRLCTFVFGTGLSYKLSKKSSTPYRVQGLYWQLSVWVLCGSLWAVYIVYVARNYRPVRVFPVRAYLIKILKIFPASLPEESWLFPVIELSRIDRYWSFLGFCISGPQFSFVVPTVECIRAYDIDLTIYSLFWTSQMMFVLWWSPERFLKSLSLSCKNVLCFLSLSLLERSYSWGFPDVKAI